MPKLTRRHFLALGGASVLTATAGTTIYLQRNDESQHVVVEHIELPIANLGAAFDGFKIVQLSDFHLRPLTEPPLIKEAVAVANSLNPDVTLLTGDNVWREVEAAFELAPILGTLNAKHGVFSVMGNHDYWTDAAVVSQAFAEARIPILINQGLTLSEAQDQLYLAGLDDGWSGHPNLTDAMDGAPERAPVVLLLHEPDLADEYASDGRIVLQLSGHSHGGQIRFPRVGALILPYLGRKYDMGLYRVGDMWLYTNRGIGVTNEPIRVNCAPEVTEITLVRA